MTFNIYEVGGAVRDELLGLKPKDVDFAVETESYAAMVKGLVKRGYTIVVETPRYFVVKAKLPAGDPREHLVTDFVLCRKDGTYTDGRRPDSVEVGTIYDDLARRDFTVNAMAKDQAGNLIDPHYGRQDLEDGLLRTVGRPEDRFGEDALRALRALRFEVTKDLWPVTRLEAALDATADDLASVSAERRREELERMFAWDTLKAWGVLARRSDRFREACFAGGIRLSATMKAGRRHG